MLGTERARNLFVKELAKVRSEYDFRLIGYVVMPNHVHLLISEPSKGTPSTALQMLKQRVSRKLRKRTARTPDPPSKPEGGAPSDLVRPTRSRATRIRVF